MNECTAGSEATVASSSNRRQFLLMGSAVAAAVLLAGDLVAEPTGLQLLAEATGPRIPVAYIEGSAGAASLAAAIAGGSARAVPAAGMGGGRALAGRPVRLTVRGFAAARHQGHALAYRHVLVDALLPSPAHRNQTIPFFAFTYRGDHAASQSAASRTRIVGGDGLRAGFRLEIAGASSSATPATTVFTSRPTHDLPTLLPGVYLLGLEQAMWAASGSLPAIDDPAWVALPSVVLVVEDEASA